MSSGRLARSRSDGVAQASSRARLPAWGFNRIEEVCAVRRDRPTTEMNDDAYPDSFLRDILIGVRTIAIVGASPRRERPSHGVMAYLQRRGYRTIPVNPNAAGATINGEICYVRLSDIPEPLDMVDVFRRSEAAGGVVDEAIGLGVRVVWMQLGVRDDTAARRARARGLTIVMNRCPAIEIPRLGL
jgi:uncharacterized protein